MPRPEGIPDPRVEQSPVRTDDAAMDRQRSAFTLAEVLARPGVLDWATLPVDYEPLELDPIEPERLAELRAKVIEIVAALRKLGGFDGG
jgi:hypothetical protein